MTSLLERALAEPTAKSDPSRERIELAQSWANGLISTRQAATALGMTVANAPAALGRILRRAIQLQILKQVEVIK
jgi:hypothetical protein